MTQISGYHIVRRFFIPNRRDDFGLPDGWKPFGVLVNTDIGYWVVARKWVRDEA